MRPCVQRRYRVCEEHLRTPQLMIEGVSSRFCQQCGKFEPLSSFDGAKRSCRARLQRHNARRRKDPLATGAGYQGGAHGLVYPRSDSSLEGAQSTATTTAVSPCTRFTPSRHTLRDPLLNHPRPSCPLRSLPDGRAVRAP
jgi:hypothetical protein